MINLAKHIVQDSDLYLDVDCEANYDGDARIWKRRVWLSKEDGAVVTSDEVLFSANWYQGFEETEAVPPDIWAALKTCVNSAIIEILKPNDNADNQSRRGSDVL